jgi:hypothetical protein
VRTIAVRPFLVSPAIDIVLGGAPCVDFSGANANRQGTNGTTGRYQVQLGELIQDIKKINAEFGHDEHVYFFSENVPMDDNLGDLTKVTKAFDLSVADPIQIDAHFYSPVCRDRMYLTNIIMDETLLVTYFDDNQVGSIMTDGYQHGALCVDTSIRVRFYCLMASFSRIDSDKMKVYKLVGGEGNEYYCRTLNVKEREAMMGYPPEYVERPSTCIVAPVSAMLQLAHVRFSRFVTRSHRAVSNTDERRFLQDTTVYATLARDSTRGLSHLWRPKAYVPAAPRRYHGQARVRALLSSSYNWNNGTCVSASVRP